MYVTYSQLVLLIEGIHVHFILFFVSSSSLFFLDLDIVALKTRSRKPIDPSVFIIFSSNLMFPVRVRNPQRQTASQTTTSFIFPTVPTIHTSSDGDVPIFNIICNNNYSQESENSCACVCLCVCEPTTYFGHGPGQ